MNSWLLSILLCMVLLVGCAAAPATVTPTETPTSSVQATASPAAKQTAVVDQTTEPAEQQPEEQPAKADQKSTAKPAQKAAVNTETNKKQNATTEKASSNTTKKEETQSTALCLPYQVPRFESEQTFRQWLINGDGNFEAERQASVAQLASGKSLRYYTFPALLNSSLLTLEKVQLEQNATFPAYSLRWADSTSAKNVMNVVAYISDDKALGDEMLARDQEKIDAGEEGWGKKTVNGIEYYYHQDTSITSGGSVHWKQYGLYGFALLYYYPERMDQLLPLLTIEPVTLRTDVVAE